MSGGSGEGTDFSSSQNIGTAFLANLFGQGASFGPTGVMFGGPGGGGGGGGGGGNFGGGSGGRGLGNAPEGYFGPGFAQQAFGSGDFSSLRNLLAPTNRNSLQEFAGAVGEQGIGGFQQAYQSVLGPGTNAISEGLNTGFRTDMSPIVDVERRRFERETVPGLVEQYAGLTGGFSSDLHNSLANASADLGVTLGSQQAQFDEAANNRRLQALTVGPAAAQAIGSMPFQAGNEMLGLGSQLQEDEYLSRPEVQLMRTLSSLFSLGSDTPGSFGESTSKQGAFL